MKNTTKNILYLYKTSIIWYKNTFIAPIIHRSIVGVLFLLSFILMLQVVLITFFIPKQSFTYTYPIIENNLLGKKLSLHSLTLDNDGVIDIKRKIVNILIKKYIQKRECYNMEDLDQLMNYIDNTSTKEELNKFKDYYYEKINKFNENIHQDVKIHSIEHISDKEVHVTFETLNYDKKKIINNKMFISKIKYDTDSIDNFVNKRRIFEYKITSYQIDKV